MIMEIGCPIMEKSWNFSFSFSVGTLVWANTQLFANTPLYDKTSLFKFKNDYNIWIKVSQFLEFLP